MFSHLPPVVSSSADSFGFKCWGFRVRSSAATQIQLRPMEFCLWCSARWKITFVIQQQSIFSKQRPGHRLSKPDAFHMRSSLVRLTHIWQLCQFYILQFYSIQLSTSVAQQHALCPCRPKAYFYVSSLFSSDCIDCVLGRERCQNTSECAAVLWTHPEWKLTEDWSCCNVEALLSLDGVDKIYKIHI